MTEKTRQTALGVFLAGVLVLTVLAVGLFAANRRKFATALGPPIVSEQLGLSISMPKDWERVSLNNKLFGPGLAYMRKSDPSADRDIYFLITPPQASSEDVLKPLGNLVGVLDINDIYFDGYQIQWSGGPTQSGRYQRRRGTISASSYQSRRLSYPIKLGLYEQITADKQVFWCIIKGNSQLDAADEALLDAVIASFEKLPAKTNQPLLPTDNRRSKGV